MLVPDVQTRSILCYESKLAISGSGQNIPIYSWTNLWMLFVCSGTIGWKIVKQELISEVCENYLFVYSNAWMRMCDEHYLNEVLTTINI